MTPLHSNDYYTKESRRRLVSVHGDSRSFTRPVRNVRFGKPGHSFRSPGRAVSDPFRTLMLDMHDVADDIGGKPLGLFATFRARASTPTIYLEKGRLFRLAQ